MSEDQGGLSWNRSPLKESYFYVSVYWGINSESKKKNTSAAEKIYRERGLSNHYFQAGTAQTSVQVVLIATRISTDHSQPAKNSGSLAAQLSCIPCHTSSK